MGTRHLPGLYWIDIAAGPGGQTISPTGIISAEAFGSTIIAGPITCTGIASAEAFGTLEISTSSGGQTISPVGISSLESFGLDVLAGPITCIGIPSGESFGVASVTTPAGGGKLPQPSRKIKKKLDILIKEELDKLFGNEYNTLLTNITTYTDFDISILKQELEAEKQKVYESVILWIHNNKQLFDSYGLLLQEDQEKIAEQRDKAIVNARLEQFRDITKLLREEEKQALGRVSLLIGDQLKKAIDQTVHEIVDVKIKKIQKQRADDEKIMALLEAFEITLIRQTFKDQ